MSTTATPTATTPTPARPRRTATRAVAGSIAFGAVAALILALVAFPGATESVITGAFLLGFAAGWALLARWSRRTAQPQGWAVVPAIAMGATGLALVATSPQDTAMTALNWVWPPAMIGLVVWMVAQQRRTLTGAGRWLLAPVMLVLVAASFGGYAENVSEVRTAHTYPATGSTYEVHGHRMHLDCRGHGGPTVVLFSGLGEYSGSWGWVTDQVSPTTRVCAYDRAGQAWSDDVPEPQDGIAAARDLHALLAAAGEHGPYVLVGHSIGGPYALTYAARYPGQVAGMVLLDSSSPEQMDLVPAYPAQYSMMRRGLAVLPTMVRIGLGRLFATGPGLPDGDVARVQAVTATARAARNGSVETDTIPILFRQAQSLTTLGRRPLAVLATSESLAGKGWDAAQDRLVALSTNHVRRDVDSTHAGLIGDRIPATTSARAVEDVVTAVRTGRPLR